VLRLACLVASVGLALVTIAGRLAWNAWPFELVTNFPVQLTIVSGLLVLVSALSRARVAWIVAVLCIGLNGVVVVRTLATDARVARKGAPTLTIGHLNAQTRSIDVVGLGRYLSTTQPDIFVVLDPTQDDAASLADSVPGYRVHMTGSAPRRAAYFIRTVVLTRVPVDQVDHPADSAFGPSAVELSVPGRAPLALVVFGTDSPTTPARAQRRDRSLDAAARWSRAHPARRVVMGDFNATPWSPSFQALLHKGKLFNSLDGFGLQPSWPESNALLRIPIDHALLGPALAATDRGTGPSFGSQHRSLHLTVAAVR